MDLSIKIEPIGKDYWGRELFCNVDTKRVYVLVEGKFHTITDEGEPDMPLRKDLRIIVMN